MKILMLVSFFQPHIGGVEKHTRRLSEELIKRGHDISIIAFKHNQTLADFEEVNKIKIYRFSDVSLSAVWRWIYKHRSLIREADVVHCHDFYTFSCWYLPFRLFYYFKPVYITFHGFEGKVPIPRKILFFRRIAEYLTKGNICIGDYIPKWYGTKADFILYGAVDDKAVTVNPNSINKAVFTGRLEQDTGIRTYLNAVKILRDKYNMVFEIDICGEGTLRGEVERFKEENKLDIKLYGFVENPADYFLKSRFVFVSGYLAILEAMICKKLVFAVYENALKRDYLSLIPDANDMMVIASSAQELAEKIAYYYNNPEESKDVIDKGYFFAKKQTWDKIADTYLKLWKV